MCVYLSECIFLDMTSFCKLSYNLHTDLNLYTQWCINTFLIYLHRYMHGIKITCKHGSNSMPIIIHSSMLEFQCLFFSSFYSLHCRQFLLASSSLPAVSRMSKVIIFFSPVRVLKHFTKKCSLDRYLAEEILVGESE